MDISNQVAMVTGGASGLGLATAKTLADAGARVVHLDINGEAATEAALETGGLGLACDVSNEESAKQAFNRVATDLDIPSILVNCAGIATPGKIVGREGALALDAYAQVINVNLVGTFNMLRLAADMMAKRDPLNGDGERGVIVNTASIAAYEGQIGQAAYASSKAGVVGLTLPAARELSKFGIRVCTIAPGIFMTPMLAGLKQEVQDALAANVPFPKRLGDPAEYGRLVQHICENVMLNGEVIRADGALRMQPI